MESRNSSVYSINYRRAVLDVDQKCRQAKSGTYVACEQMIRMSFMRMRLATLGQILEQFESSRTSKSVEACSTTMAYRLIWIVSAG